MLEFLGTVIASVLVELVVSPLRFLGWLVVAAAAAAVCLWASLRVGRLFNLSHNPGAVTVAVALLAAFTAGAAVVTLQALSHSRTLAAYVFVGAQTGREFPARACRTVESVLPYVSRHAGYAVDGLDCDTSTAGAPAQRDEGMAGAYRWLQTRLRRSQIITLAGSFTVLMTCLLVPSWLAYRDLRVHTSATDRPTR